MARVTVTRRVEAPPATVFALFSDFENAAGRVTAIKKIELLTPGPVGVGTRFRETRVVFGREATEEMEVTAFEPGRHYALTARSCGAEYRSGLHFRPDGSGTVVEASFEARPLTLLARLLSPLTALMSGVLKKCLEGDVEDLKKIAEGAASPA
jgi:hypothetical protein